MKNIYKQLEVLGIRLRTDTFSVAKLKLAGLYIIIATVVATSITIVVYEIFLATIENNIEYNLIVLTYGTEAGREFIAVSSKHLLLILFKVDLIILFVVAIFGYFFSDYILRPVRLNVQRQKRFISDAAHELRTPLAVMKTGIETLPVKNFSEQETKELKKDLMEEIQMLINTTNNLLFLSVENAQKVKKGPIQKTNMSKICEEQIRYIKPYVKNKNIILEDNISDDCFVELQTDEIIHLVRNLLKNASDYTFDEGKIIAQLYKDKNKVVFKLSDTGIGIPPSEKPYIFERFYKAENSKTVSQGSGLGLAIVYAIVKKAYGNIEIESKEGVGTTVIVSIPAV